jgi:hypothetical protein
MQREDATTGYVKVSGCSPHPDDRARSGVWLEKSAVIWNLAVLAKSFGKQL